jgi:hypothetical protein
VRARGVGIIASDDRQQCWWWRRSRRRAGGDGAGPHARAPPPRWRRPGSSALHQARGGGGATVALVPRPLSMRPDVTESFGRLLVQRRARSPPPARTPKCAAAATPSPMYILIIDHSNGRPAGRPVASNNETKRLVDIIRSHPRRRRRRYTNDPVQMHPLTALEFVYHFLRFICHLLYPTKGSLLLDLWYWWYKLDHV